MKRPRGAGGEKQCVGRGRVHTLGPSEEDGQHVGEGREQRPLQPEATRSVLVEGTVPDCTADCTGGCLKASSWDGARCGQRPETPQTKKPGRAGGVKLGSAAADCLSWEAPQVGRN